MDRSAAPPGRQKRSDERQHPPPDLAAHTSGLRILGWAQPQGVTHARPFEAPLLPPHQDQGQDEHPDEPYVEENQERLSKRLAAPKVMAEPGSNDPGKNGHRAGRCRPHPQGPPRSTAGSRAGCADRHAPRRRGAPGRSRTRRPSRCATASGSSRTARSRRPRSTSAGYYLIEAADLDAAIEAAARMPAAAHRRGRGPAHPGDAGSM